MSWHCWVAARKAWRAQVSHAGPSSSGLRRGWQERRVEPGSGCESGQDSPQVCRLADGSPEGAWVPSCSPLRALCLEPRQSQGRRVQRLQVPANLAGSPGPPAAPAGVVPRAPEGQVAGWGLHGLGSWERGPPAPVEPRLSPPDLSPRPSVRCCEEPGGNG